LQRYYVLQVTLYHSTIELYLMRYNCIWYDTKIQFCSIRWYTIVIGVTLLL